MPDAATDWSLQIATPGTLDGLALLPHERKRWKRTKCGVSVRAAGVNFRDVLSTLGMYPGDAGPLGLEGSGVVTEVGSDVTDLKPGDRVMGLVTRGFGPSAVTRASRCWCRCLAGCRSSRRRACRRCS